MKIDWIDITNFRSIGKKGIHLDFENFNTIRNPAILVGENNAGKSNILRVIEFMVDAMAGKTDVVDSDWHLKDTSQTIIIKSQITLRGEIVNEMMEAFLKDTKYITKQTLMDQLKNELTDKLLIEVRIQKDDKNRDRVCFRWGALCFNSAGTLGFDDSWRGCSSKKMENKNRLLRTWVQMVDDPNNKEEEKLEAALKQSLESKNIFFDIPDLPSKIEDYVRDRVVVFSKIRNQPKGELFSRDESIDASDLDAVLVNLMLSSEIKKRKKYREIVRLFEKYFSEYNISPTQNPDNKKPQLRIARLKDGHEFPIQFMGTGTLEFLYILVKTTLSEDKIILVEDPQLHLHPQAQRATKNLLFELAKKNQVILTTHSTIFLDTECLENNIVIRLKDRETEVSCIEKSLSEREKSALDFFLDTEKRGLFFSKLTILVDGPTELGALPIFAKSKGVDFDASSICVLSLGTKNNLEKAAKILDVFNIPWIAICDRDAGMRIESSIESKKVPLLFKQLHSLGKLESKHLQFLGESQEQQEWLSEDLFQEIQCMMQDYGCFLLSSNFEGILESAGYKTLFDEAEKIVGKSKPRKGKYVAKKIVQEKKELPLELLEMIKYIRAQFALKCLTQLNESHTSS